MAALEDQVFIQKKEMKDLKGDAKEKLTSAGDHVRQTRHEVANLKSKVRIEIIIISPLNSGNSFCIHSFPIIY